MLHAILSLVLAAVSGAPPTAQGGCRKVDEVPDLSCEDVQTRLDAYGVGLEDEPGARGFIVFHEGRRQGGAAPRRGEAFAEASGYKDYLVSVRGIGPNRVVLINGGGRENFAAEFYACTGGAAPPRATPAAEGREVKYRRGRVTRDRHRWCCGCL